VSDNHLFTAKKFDPPPENYDEVLDRVVVIDALPGGIGQEDQKLTTPIESMHFKRVEVKEQEKAADVPVRMVTAEEAKRLISSGEFHKSMIPRKLRCRDCGVELPPERGLLCKECLPSLHDDPGHYLYCGVSGE